MSNENQPTIPLFDYGSINEVHVEAAKEICRLLDENGQSTMSELVKTRFKVREIPKFNLDNSSFVQEARKHGIFCGIQGFIQEGIEPDLTQYQLLAVCDDVRKLDKFIDAVKDSVRNS